MDQSEDLDQLAGEAQLLDTSPTKAEEAQAQRQEQEAGQAVDSNAGQLLAAATMIRAMWLPLLPKSKGEALAYVWRDEVLAGAAQAGAQVLVLHGIDMGEVVGRLGPYVALIAALGPPVLSTVQIMKAPEPKAPAVQQQQEGAAHGQAGQQQPA